MTMRHDTCPLLSCNCKVNKLYNFKDVLVKKAGQNLIVEIGKFIGGQVQIEEQERVRKSDIYLDFAKTFNYTITFKIPQGYTVKGLDNLNVDVANTSGYFKSTASIENNTVIINTEKVYQKNFVENKDWTSMTEWLDAAYEFSQAKILLQP